jgi:hypothetical protein
LLVLAAVVAWLFNSKAFFIKGKRMASQVPWKELAVVGAATLGVCCMVGWLTGAENLQVKKKAPHRGSPNGNTVESQECDALISIAGAAMEKAAYDDVELAYLFLYLFIYPFVIKNKNWCIISLSLIVIMTLSCFIKMLIILRYLKALEISSNSEDPRIQIYPLYIHRRLVELYEKMGKFEKCVKHIEVYVENSKRIEKRVGKE